MNLIGWECPHCNRLNDDPNQWCRQCGAPKIGMELICPNCQQRVNAENDFCPHCGKAMREKKEKKRQIQNDPQLAFENSKYEKARLNRFRSGIVAISWVAAFYMWLENMLPDIFFTLSGLSFLVSLICFITFSLKVARLKRIIDPR